MFELIIFPDSIKIDKMIPLYKKGEIILQSWQLLN